MNKKILVSMLLCFSVFSLGMIAQEKQKPYGPIYLLRGVGDGLIFFWQNDPPEPAGNGPVVPEGLVLAPITEEKVIEFETGRTTIPGGTIANILEVRIYLRQRYFYRNDGQNSFRATTFPIIELESPVFNGLIDPFTGEPSNGVITYTLSGLHLDASKALVSGEWGNDSRGNFMSDIWTEEWFDKVFGKGIGKEVFKNDLTIRMRVKNWVKGLTHFVVGTNTLLYGN
jgi:hypothetical protein